MEKFECKSIDNSIAQTKETQAKIKPECALELLKAGNTRFVKKLTIRRDLKSQIKETSSGQYPFAVIVSCLDSRVPTELIFDQGIGDVFNARIAGNFVNEDILGSLEFAHTIGACLIVVLGHTRCGAIGAAITNYRKRHTQQAEQVVGCQHILPMVKKLYPAVKDTTPFKEEEDSEYHNRVVRKNVELNIEVIRKKSDCLRIANRKKQIDIVGGVYDVTSGRVSFFDHLES
jgi:carbonic anhydrase